MNCSQVQQQLSAHYRAGAVPTETATAHADAVRRHVGSCELCQQFESDLILHAQLNSLQIPGPRAGFVDVALAAATSAAAPQNRKTYSGWAVAATLLIGLSLGVLVSNTALQERQAADPTPTTLAGAEPPITDPTVPGEDLTAELAQPLQQHLHQPQTQPVALILNQAVPINVVIDSDAEQLGATITVSLADNVMLDGYPDNRELTWQADLKQGKNLLTLPLIINNTDAGHFDIAYQAGGQTHRVTVNLIATAPAAQPTRA